MSAPTFLSVRHACALTVLALLLGTGTARADRADRLQPMNVEADSLRVDDARQNSVFSGNVVVSKGSIRIRGQQLEVRQDEQGNQFGTVLGGPGQPAFFRQKREGLDEFIEGEAQRIDYNGQADTVRFTGQAVLRRFKGATLNDETRGGLIVYDNRSATFAVDSGAQPAPDNPSGRVRAMLTPRSPTPPAPPASPGPALQPSSRLESRP
jgi:lipopolysaccharide export system protein LptA